MELVESVEPCTGEYVETTDGSYIRYSADSWVWRIGESTETIHNLKQLKELEDGYQDFKRRQEDGNA